MREIKFRIRNLKESCVDHIWGDPEDIYIRASDGKAVYFDGFANCMLEYDEPQNIAIEQYTGLKDKNGKEIYEGDRVKWDKYNREYTVDYENGAFWIDSHNGDLDVHTFSIDVHANHIKIIGNIHEETKHEQ